MFESCSEVGICVRRLFYFENVIIYGRLASTVLVFCKTVRLVVETMVFEFTYICSCVYLCLAF